MAIVDRSTLKGYFNTGDKPTEAQFANLIDSMPNLVDDGSVIKTVKISPAAADILTLASIPIVGVSAPGAGKYLSCIGVDIIYEPVTTAYDAIGSIIVSINGADYPLFRFTGGLTGLTTGIIVKAQQSSNGSFGQTQMLENASIIISCTADSTVGDADISFLIRYQEVAL